MNTTDLTLIFSLTTSLAAMFITIFLVIKEDEKENIISASPVGAFSFFAVFLLTITVSQAIIPTSEVVNKKCIQEQKVIKLLKVAHKDQPWKYGHKVLLKNGTKFRMHTDGSYKGKVEGLMVCTQEEIQTKEYYINSSFEISNKVVVSIDNKKSYKMK